MPAIRRRWTTADVRELTRDDRAWPRYELIGGELLVTPAPRSALSDLELQPDTITQPDVFVIPIETAIAGDALEWPDVKSLLLAIEVLSPTSLRNDRVRKRDFYLENGVEEYWIVDLDARVFERWRPAQETPELLHDRLAWTPRGRESLEIDVPAFFERIDRRLRMFAR